MKHIDRSEGRAGLKFKSKFLVLQLNFHARFDNAASSNLPIYTYLTFTTEHLI